MASGLFTQDVRAGSPRSLLLSRDVLRLQIRSHEAHNGDFLCGLPLHAETWIDYLFSFVLWIQKYGLLIPFVQETLDKL